MFSEKCNCSLVEIPTLPKFPAEIKAISKSDSPEWQLDHIMTQHLATWHNSHAAKKLPVRMTNSPDAVVTRIEWRSLVINSTVDDLDESDLVVGGKLNRQLVSTSFKCRGVLERER